MESFFSGESKLFPKQSKSASGGQGAGDQYTGNRPGDIPAWQERFEYDLGREVIAPDGSYYRCIDGHIASNSFAVDLAFPYWIAFAGPAIDTDDQVLSIDMDGVTLRLSGGSTGGVPIPDSTVDLTPFLDNTDDQEISLDIDGTTLRLSNGIVPDTTVDLSPFFQELSIVNDELFISDGNSVDLSPYVNPPMKSGVVLAASFSLVGGLMVADVVFGTAFATANYSPTASTLNTDSYGISFSNIATTGFRINLNSNVAPANNVLWNAILHGEY